MQYSWVHKVFILKCNNLLLRVFGDSPLQKFNFGSISVKWNGFPSNMKLILIAHKYVLLLLINNKLYCSIVKFNFKFY